MGQGTSAPANANGATDSILIRQGDGNVQQQQENATAANNDLAQERLRIHGAIEAAAAEVYENVHSELLAIQQNSVRKSEDLARSLQQRIQPIEKVVNSKSTVCNDHRSVLLECLKKADKGSNSLLACADVIDSYSVCALGAGSD